jgi:hypothetical protein
MATKDQVNSAITAVKNGVATPQQEKWAADAAKQAGSTGNRAREAFKGK